MSAFNPRLPFPALGIDCYLHATPGALEALDAMFEKETPYLQAIGLGLSRHDIKIYRACLGAFVHGNTSAIEEVFSLMSLEDIGAAIGDAISLAISGKKLSDRVGG